MQCGNWLRAAISSGAWWKVGSIPRAHALSNARQRALSARFWPPQAFPVHNRSRRVRLLFRVAALDQVDGIERAVDRVMPPEEEAGKRHYLAVAVGQECRHETRHRPVQQNPEPPAPGNEKKERHERERSPEDHGPQPGMRYPLAKLPEEDEVQSRRQEQAACHLANQRKRQPGLRHCRSDQDEPQQAKHQTRVASTPAYLPANGKAGLFRFRWHNNRPPLVVFKNRGATWLLRCPGEHAIPPCQATR